MELPNIHFQDFPIEFKEINPQDFPNFVTQEKIIISPSSEGYINEELQANITLEEKNTVVINAAVGQGKTYSIIEIIKRFYEAEEEYMIFVASPFVSLVQQYYSKLLGVGIPENQIYRYESIGTETHLDAWNSKIQIMTVNCLLGNPGEDKLTNSVSKRNYINYLSSKCEENNRKVVFIYDELHDAIHNFKEEYIFNLWKWRNIIHKNILLSATYNEASKIVIEYLAELTENRIQIIESARTRFPEKQSELFLHFNPSKSYRSDNDGIVAIISDLITREKNIDILSFSKSFADDVCDITHVGIGALFANSGISIQNCTSDLDENVRTYTETPDNRYDPSKCNIGTNFKTGVSIEKENHAFVIIMPPLGAKGSFRNKYGIFSGGINSVVQALARQRVKGEIHIVLSPPEKFDYESLNFQSESKLRTFKNFYSLVEYQKSNSENKVKYHKLNNQDELLYEYYSTELYGNIQLESEHISSLQRDDKIRLEYPSFKQFKLEKGEHYLSSEIKFFGKDLSSYITYCAITNQFVNCNLAGINSKPVLYFEVDKIQLKLEEYYQSYMDDSKFNLFFNLNDSWVYELFKNELFSNYKLKLDDGETQNDIKPNFNKNFEIQLLGFIQRKLYPQNRYFRSKFYGLTGVFDYKYSRGDYFLACISHSNRINVEVVSDDEFLVNRVNAFRTLDYFRNKLISNIQQSASRKRGEFNYLPKSHFSNFMTESEVPRFESMVIELSQNDCFLKNNIFEFKRRLETDNDLETRKATFYKMLITDFFDKETYKLTVDDRINIWIINNVIEVPSNQEVMNMVTPSRITPQLKRVIDQLYGSVDRYNEIINEAIESSS